MSTADSCRWCKHWVNSEKAFATGYDQEGSCRRYPQSITTTEGYRCGEFHSNDQARFQQNRDFNCGK